MPLLYMSTPKLVSLLMLGRTTGQPKAKTRNKKCSGYSLRCVRHASFGYNAAAVERTIALSC